MFPWDPNSPQLGQPDSRSVTVPAFEPDVGATPGTPILALGLFELRLRDQIDFSVDFSAWLAANGSNAQLTNVTWSAASGSPKTPTIVGSTFSPLGKCVVVLTAGTNASIGDTYWLDITVTIGATTPVNPNDVAIPVRALVRRIHVIVVNG